MKLAFGTSQLAIIARWIKLGISIIQFVEASSLTNLSLHSFQVFRRIEKQLPQLTTIDLQYVSPKLLQAENLELAVPGV